MKRCKKCKEVKPFSDFSISGVADKNGERNKPGHFKTVCRVCARDIYKEKHQTYRRPETMLSNTLVTRFLAVKGKNFSGVVGDEYSKT